MAKGLQYRSVGGGRIILPAPLYVDDDLLSTIVLGSKSDRWPLVRRVFRRQGMPGPRASVCGLYYLPAVLKFLDDREGVVVSDGDDFPEDGPDKLLP